jgi:hypothetical protein
VIQKATSVAHVVISFVFLYNVQLPALFPEVRNSARLHFPVSGECSGNWQIGIVDDRPNHRMNNLLGT